MTIKYFLTVGFEVGGTDNIGVHGLVTERDDGTTRYRSYTQNGTKPKASVAAAIPRTFTGYIVNADSVDQAIRATKAFRGGADWAMPQNSTIVRTVRNGRVEE